jgi:hypothetical protein
MENPKVVEQIENNKESVIIGTGSAPGLQAGNGKITGLNPNKSYMIESENGSVLDYPQYVTDFTGIGPGGLTVNLRQITRISGGSINNLTNFHTYKVREAAQFPNGTDFTYNPGGTPVYVSNGIITIPSSGTLDLTSELTVGASYEVIAVAVPPSPATTNWDAAAGGTHNSITRTNWSALPLEGEGTTVDYVFVKTDAPLDFKVLRVVITGEGTINIIATFTPTAEAVWTFSAATINLSPASPTATVTLTSAFDTNSIVWKLNGVTQTGTQTLINLDFDTLVAILPQGDYNLVVEGRKSGLYYSSPPITVNIGNPYP